MKRSRLKNSKNTCSVFQRMQIALNRRINIKDKFYKGNEYYE